MSRLETGGSGVCPGAASMGSDGGGERRRFGSGVEERSWGVQGANGPQRSLSNGPAQYKLNILRYKITILSSAHTSVSHQVVWSTVKVFYLCYVVWVYFHYIC